MFDAHGEVVLVVLEPAEHGAGVGRDESDAPSETAMREVGGGGVGVQRSEGIAAPMRCPEAHLGNNAQTLAGTCRSEEIAGMSMRINLTPDEERAVADTYSRTWWLWLVAGILWLLLGFIVLSLRPASITACTILIAIASGSAASPTSARVRARGRVALARVHRWCVGAARRHRRGGG